MPIVMAILSIAQGLSQARHGDRAGGLMSMYSGFSNFGSLVNNFNAINSNSFAADGVRRNYL